MADDDLMAHDAPHCLNDTDRGSRCPSQYTMPNCIMLATSTAIKAFRFEKLLLFELFQDGDNYFWFCCCIFPCKRRGV